MLKQIQITEIENIRIGHAQDMEHATGCTVIICENGAPAGVDVRGGGPASRETELLRPVADCTGIHALLLSGGSAFGLDAAGGVMEYLEERNIGFDVGVTKREFDSHPLLKRLTGLIKPIFFCQILNFILHVPLKYGIIERGDLYEIRLDYREIFNDLPSGKNRSRKWEKQNIDRKNVRFGKIYL